MRNRKILENNCKYVSNKTINNLCDIKEKLDIISLVKKCKKVDNS